MRKTILSVLSIALSLTWLLPNHNLPWLGFHSDAWCAVVLIVTSCLILFHERSTKGISHFSVVLLLIVPIPIIQYLSGGIELFGIAWINFAYLLGFLCAVLMGELWARSNIDECLDFLFSAIVIASMVSVALQWYQFFALEIDGPWIVFSTGSRHFANMAQPNQLCSLLLLGILGCGWGAYRKAISPLISTLLAFIFMTGAVLTESRTGWLNVMLIVGVAFAWKKVLPGRSFFAVIAGLALSFIVLTLLLPRINEYSGYLSPIIYRSNVDDPRWAAWKMFVEAIRLNPWGYGWGQLSHAQFLMIDKNVVLGGNYLQAHNIFIDILLWNGILVGLAISFYMVLCVYKSARRVGNFRDVLLLLFVGILGVHSLLEYPLQYAYFLLPLGMVIGCIIVGSGYKEFGGAGVFVTRFAVLSSIVVLTITVVDYFNVERSFYGLRFELKNINSDFPKEVPNVYALTQWRDYIEFARYNPELLLSADELTRRENLVKTLPSAFAMYRFSVMLAFNDKPEDAQLWLRRICQTTPMEHCELIRAEWAFKSTLSPVYSKIPWPYIK